MLIKQYLSQYRLLLLIFLAIIAGAIAPYLLPTNTLKLLLTFSIIIKEVVVTLLPLLIFSCIAVAFIHNKSANLTMFLIIILLICLSNVVSTMVAYGVSKAFMSHDSIPMVHPQGQLLEPLFHFHLPQILPPEFTLFFGILLGWLTRRFNLHYGKMLIEKTYNGSMFFLHKIFIPIVPIFILGFITKLAYEETLHDLFASNWQYLLIIISTLIIYLTAMTLISSICAHLPMLTIIRNISTSAITAFSTMSSMASLPLSIASGIRNTKDKSFVNVYMPLSVNIHLIGDSIGVPILTMMLMKHFQGSIPPFEQYFVFILYFVMAKFAIAAVPGGGIIVMLPILEKVFNFTPEMSAIITTFYILFDPIFTCSNVTGNNLMCIILERVFWRRTLKRPSSYA